MERRAFTLIELLVVIAIIALLLSILMPALRKVKSQTQAVVCMSNLKQWGVVFGLYLQDNKNNFPLVTMRTDDVYDVWVEPLRPYYKGGGEDMRVCPTATKSEQEGARGWFVAWDKTWVNPLINPEKDFRCSYGINNWVYNSPDEFWWEVETKYCWRRGDVKGANRIPLFMDCYRWGGTPKDTDTPCEIPPQTNKESDDASNFFGGMNRFCLDRHNGSINMVFVDLSAGKMPLKEMWKLKWSTHFNTNNDQTKEGAYWPPWIR